LEFARLTCAAFNIRLTYTWSVLATGSGNAGTCEKHHDRSWIRFRKKAGVCANALRVESLLPGQEGCVFSSGHLNIRTCHYALVRSGRQRVKIPSVWHVSAKQEQTFDTVEESSHTKGGMQPGHSPQQSNTTYWHSNEPSPRMWSFK
jgi:hypothetical protein